MAQDNTVEALKLSKEFSGYRSIEEFIFFLSQRTDRKAAELLKDFAKLAADIQELGK